MEYGREIRCGRHWGWAGRIQGGKTVRTARGIYRRTEHGLDPWFLITKAPSYKPIFPFFEVAQRVAQAHTPTEFGKALAEALATSTFRSPRRFSGGPARGLFDRTFGGGAG